MKREKPILFSTLMIQAILAGRKTQTRRIIKPQPQENDHPDKLGKFWWKGSHGWDERQLIPLCPYGQIGDILWVRETFIPPMGYGTISRYIYKATEDLDCFKGLWKPSIFMPKEACRIKLEITNIRVEKLQNISEEDVIAEGIIGVQRPGGFGFGLKKEWDYKFPLHERTPIDAYRMLWEKINGKDSWFVNPLVWVIEFKIAL